MEKKRQYLLITALAAVAILVAGFMFAVKPQHKKASDLASQRDAIEQQTSTLRVQLSGLMSQKAGLKAEQAKLRAVQVKLPSTVELPALTRDLAARAKLANVELVSVAPGTPVTSTPGASTTTTTLPTGVTPVPVTLGVSGSFYDLESFFAQLEDMPRALLVDGFTVATNTTATTPSATTATIGAGELTVTVQARVFVLNPDSAAASSASAPTTTTGAPGASAVAD